MDIAEDSPEAQAALKVYQELIQNGQILASGLKFFEDTLNKIPNFAVISTKLYISWGEKDKKTRVYIGALLKNMLRELWESNPAISSQKNDIRESLLRGLLINVGNLEIIESLVIKFLFLCYVKKKEGKALMIINAMKFDGVDLWVPFLKEIEEWMTSDDNSIINTGLELFCTIFSKVNEGRYNKIFPEEFSLAPIIPTLLLSLIQIFAKPELNEKQREKLLVLLYLAIRQIAYADGQDNKLVAKCFDETYKTWMSLFISALQTSPKKHITMKRYILKILNVIFRDFTFYSRDSLPSRIQPIWKFFNSLLPLYTWTCVHGIPLSMLDNNLNPIQDPQQLITQSKANSQQESDFKDEESLDVKYLDQEDEFSNEVEGMTLNAIELVSTVITKDAFYQLVKYAVFPIINALSHFILLPKSQEKQWLEEPKQFVNDDEDEISMKQMRKMVQYLIFQLIQTFGDQATQALLVVAEKFMMNYDQAHTSSTIQAYYDKSSAGELKVGGTLDFSKDKLMEFVKSSGFDCSLPEQIWKKKEVGLLLLGKFQNDVIDFQYKHTSSFDMTALIKNLISQIEVENQIPLLIAKSLWCIQRFSEIIAVKNTALFLPLFKMAVSNLSKDQEFPIRLTALKAVGVFAQKIKKYEQSLPDKETWGEFRVEDTTILEDIFDILFVVNVDTVYIILETLVSLNKLSKQYIPEVALLGARPIQELLTLHHGDPTISRLLMELITQLAEDPNSFGIIFQTAFSSFIMTSFTFFHSLVQENSSLTQVKPQELPLMANIFEVTSVFVKNCHDNQSKESLISLLPPLLNIMSIIEENVLQQHASICLKNFLIVADQFIIKNFLVKDVLQVIMKLLQVPTQSQFEGSSTYAGNLCMIAFNNLLGGSADPEILKQVVYKIFRSKLATTVQGLVLVWARMIIHNPLESVNFLCSFSVENRIALKTLIDKWLLFQPVFRGKYTKMAIFLALTKLFLLKDKRIENLIAIAYNPSHSNVGNDVSAPFKIFSTLIRGLDNEMAPSRKDKDLADDSTRQSSDKTEDDDDERLEAEDDENDFNINFKEDNDDKIEVDLNVIQDEEDNDIQKRFAVGENKAGGLGEFEVGSTNYITEGFAFGYDEGDECDETTEEDLIYLKDQFPFPATSDMLKNFFSELAKNDPKYLAECLKHLLKEDIQLLQKYVSLKNLESLQSSAQSVN